MRISDWSSDVCSSDLAINASGYGLTLGVHTRIDGVAAHIAARAAVGNVYVNRNQIGAIVGSQPFGGRGLSGTGPKAGGPHYLHRFAEEKSLSTDKIGRAWWRERGCKYVKNTVVGGYIKKQK